MATQEPTAEEMVKARLLELVDHRTPWHRSHWQVGSVLALRELLEYAEAVRTEAVARTEGLQYVAESVAGLVDRDLGLGSDNVRARIKGLIDKPTDKRQGPINPAMADLLVQMVDRVSDGYLARWAGICDRGELKSEQIELLSRLTAGHLLDSGFSADHLHGWLRAQPGRSLPELLQQANELCERPIVKYELIVPFEKLPKEVVGAAGERHLSDDDLRALCERYHVDEPSGLRQAGSLRFNVNAREPRAAISMVEAEVRRLGARVAVGLSQSQVVPLGEVLVLGAARTSWKELRSWRKEVRVPSLVRNDLLLPAEGRRQSSDALDDAFELLAAMETSTTWASVAATWAVVEGLLSRPGDSGAGAADRMADVVACSFPRAELTQLADVVGEGSSALADRFSGVDTSSAKVRLTLDAIIAGEDIGLSGLADKAALARIQAVVASPKVVLHRVRRYYAEAFRRLFQQRNIVMHGARSDSIALPATLRTVPSLVAAGVDRLVHAATREDRLEPLALAAMARNELELIGDPGGRRIDSLLG